MISYVAALESNEYRQFTKGLRLTRDTTPMFSSTVIRPAQTVHTIGSNSDWHGYGAASDFSEVCIYRSIVSSSHKMDFCPLVHAQWPQCTRVIYFHGL